MLSETFRSDDPPQDTFLQFRIRKFLITKLFFSDEKPLTPNSKCLNFEGFDLGLNNESRIPILGTITSEKNRDYSGTLFMFEYKELITTLLKVKDIEVPKIKTQIDGLNLN